MKTIFSTNRRQKRAARNRQYLRAQYYLADHLIRLGKHNMEIALQWGKEGLYSVYPR